MSSPFPIPAWTAMVLAVVEKAALLAGVVAAALLATSWRTATEEAREAEVEIERVEVVRREEARVEAETRRGI